MIPWYYSVIITQKTNSLKPNIYCINTVKHIRIEISRCKTMEP